MKKKAWSNIRNAWNSISQRTRLQATAINGRLSVCGVEDVQTCHNLVNPRKPTDKSFAELVNLVKNYLNPRPSSIVYRFKFNNRFRQQQETIQQYVAKLRNLSKHCEFGNQMEKMICDRLVCGVNEERIKRRLLAEGQLQFKKAMESATSMETAGRNTGGLHNGNPSTRENPEEQSVNSVTKNPPKNPKLPPRNLKQPNVTRECFRCRG